MSEACRHFETPITGGNVSLYNETLGEAIWPTPVMGVVGLLKTAPPVTIPFKRQGREVLLLGGLGAVDATRFGGTQYAKAVLNRMWGLPPALDMDYEKRVHTAVREVIAQSVAESSHDVGEGGLGVALAECCAEGTGASITLDTRLRPEFALFHEAPSRILISTNQPEAVEKIARENNVECLRLGVTMKERLQISNGSVTHMENQAVTWIDCRVERLREVWETALENLLSPVAVG
jgi:phosphoribosylformylglycinamidine synthase